MQKTIEKPLLQHIFHFTTVNKPIIYQLLPRLFGNLNDACIPSGTIEQNGVGKLNDINRQALRGIRELGATHVWLTGVLEHATSTDYSRYGIAPDNHHVVKGKAGSPYAVKDYYDIDPDLAENVEGRLSEFDDLVERIHQEGMKVIIDFVPNHVARHYHSDAKPCGVEDFGARDDTSLYFGHDNNFYYIPRQLFAPHVDLGTGKGAYIEFPAKASGNDCFTAFPGVNDWYDTVKLNYGVDYGDSTRHFVPVPDTWMKMIHILRYWAARHVDAFRCDMVHMVPIEFWRWAIPSVRRNFPDVKFIAEIYDTALYRPFIEAGFDYLYDKVNLYDTLRGIQCHSLSAAQLTSCWQTVEGISGNMLNFLENHDEQRFGSRHYAGDPAKVIPSLVVSSMFSTGPMMIYMGQELGEQATDAEGFSGPDGRTTIFDYWSLATLRRWIGPERSADGLGLTPREKWLRGVYSTILNICNSETAISRGAFFDLMYVNYENQRFNPHRQYAFLRSADDVTLMIVANFSPDSCDLAVNIPTHAFETLGIPAETEVTATELLTGQTMKKTLSPDRPFETYIPAWNAVVWRIDHRTGPQECRKTSRASRAKSKK